MFKPVQISPANNIEAPSIQNGFGTNRSALLMFLVSEVLPVYIQKRGIESTPSLGTCTVLDCQLLLKNYTVLCTQVYKVYYAYEVPMLTRPHTWLKLILWENQFRRALDVTIP